MRPCSDGCLVCRVSAAVAIGELPLALAIEWERFGVAAWPRCRDALAVGHLASVSRPRGRMLIVTAALAEASAAAVDLVFQRAASAAGLALRAAMASHRTLRAAHLRVVRGRPLAWLIARAYAPPTLAQTQERAARNATA